MTNLPAKLQQLIQTKADIKAAIENIDVSLNGVSFTQYGDTLGTELSATDTELIDVLGEDVAGGTLWTPAEISTDIWFDANDVDSITKNESNLISSWNDLSGNTRHATAGNAPLHYYDETLAKWVVRFDGSNDFMTFNGSFINAANKDFSLFCLIRRRSDKKWNYYIGSTYGNGVYGGWWSPSTSTALDLSRLTSSRIFVEGYDSGALRAELHSVTRVYETGEYNGYWHGEFRTNSVAPGDIATWATAYIGRHASEYFNGDVLEVICIDGAGAVNRQKVEGYLAHKWGIRLINHPYSYIAPRIPAV